MALALGIIFLALILGLCFHNSCKSIYAWTDHYGWAPDSTPDKNAKILDITSEKVRYGSSSTYAKLKTKITFSDGFYFITHKTDYNHTGAVSYQMFLSDELKEKIIGLAIEQHNKSVNDYKNNKSEDNTCTADTKTKNDITQIKIKIVNDKRYINLDSDNRIKYLNTLQQQTVSELNKFNKILKAETNKIRNIPADIAQYIKSNDTPLLRQDILKLENKKLALDELIATEINDKYKRKEYETLSKKATATAQIHKDKNISVVSLTDVMQTETTENINTYDDDE